MDDENLPYETMRDLAVAAMNGSCWVKLNRIIARQICDYLTLEEISKFLENSDGEVKTGIKEYLQERETLSDIENGFATVDTKGNLVYYKENVKNDECSNCNEECAMNKYSSSNEEYGTITEG